MSHIPLPRPGRRNVTARHLDILRLVAGGQSTRQIAQLLRLSEDTVKTHLRHAFLALEVHTRAQAVAEAYRRGLLLPGPIDLPRTQYGGPERRRGPGRRASDIRRTHPAPSRP